MDYLKQYVIPFSGLALGNHQYTFALGDKFFESFEYSGIQHGDVRVSVDLEKQEQMLIFRFNIEGYVRLQCDRCLDDLDIEVTDEEQLIVKFGSDFHEETEDIVYIPQNEHEFDISQFLYEYISLSIPIQHIHPDDEDGNSTCNPEFLERLNSLNKNNQLDPRWEKLRGLQSENEEEK